MTTKANPNNFRTLTHAEWTAEAEKRFGKDAGDWRFVCPVCGHVQSINRVHEHNPGLEKKAIANWIHFSCEGRRNEIHGCDYTTGGLISVSPIHVVTDNGTTNCAFDFAAADQLETEGPRQGWMSNERWSERLKAINYPNVACDGRVTDI